MSIRNLIHGIIEILVIMFIAGVFAYLIMNVKTNEPAEPVVDCSACSCITETAPFEIEGNSL